MGELTRSPYLPRDLQMDQPEERKVDLQNVSAGLDDLEDAVRLLDLLIPATE
jgi:hypothetical protein